MTSSHLSSLTEYNFKKNIGSSCYGEVNLFEIDEKLYVVKEFDLNKVSDDEERKNILNKLHEEYKLLKTGIKNVIKTHGAYHDKTKHTYKFSMDYCEENLFEFLQKGEAVSFEVLMNLVKDIVTG